MTVYGMVSNILAVCLLTVLVLTLLKSFADGLKLYLALAYTAPCLISGTFRISFETASFLVLFLFSILKSGWVIRLRKDHRFWGMCFAAGWFIFFVVVSFVNICLVPGLRARPARVFGLFRFIYTQLLLAGAIKNREDFFRTGTFVYRTFLMVNVPVLASQYVLPSSLACYYTLFGRTDSSAYLNEIKIGFYTRGYGTTYSPTALGIVSVFITAFFIVKYLHDRRREDICLLAAGVMTGVLSGSKMFVFSLVIICGICLAGIPLFKGPQGLRRMIKLAVAGICMLAVSIMVLAYFSQLDRILFYVTNPLENLKSRYGAGGSIYSADKSVLLDKLFFGYGASVRGMELIGDSMYYVMIHDMGITGTVLYATALLAGLIQGLRTKDVLKVLYVLLIFGMGAGDPLYFAFPAVLPTCYVLFVKNQMTGGRENADKWMEVL